MEAITPTLWQRAIASDRLPRTWFLAIPLAIAIWTVHSVGPIWLAFSNVSSAALYLAIFLLSALLGLVTALPLGWLVLGPLLMIQGQRNGGPFKPGDLVQIASGIYRNRLATVYSTWQADTVRVDLGEEAKTRYEDIFAAYQLLRVERPRQAEDGDVW